MRSVAFYLVLAQAVVFNLIAPAYLNGASSQAKPRFAYVANNQDGSVSVFEVDDFMLRARDYAYIAGSSPLSVSLTPSQKFLYVGGNGSFAALSWYGVNAETGQLTFLSTLPTGGMFQLQVDPTGKFLLSVDGNEVQSYRINNQTGALTLAGFVSGGDPFALAVHPSGKYVYAINEQTNAVTALNLNSTTGTLTKIAGSPFLTHSQSPWAATIDPGGNYLFIPNANGENVSVFAINQTNGALTQVPGSPFPAGSAPDTVVVSPNGQFLYVGNGGDRTISAYSINTTTGSLTAITGSPFPAGASGPLGLAIDPTGSVLYSMDHDSNEVAIFRITASTGALTPENTVRSRGAAISMAIVSGKDSATYVPKSAYVANADSNNISGFGIATSGSLTAIAGSPFSAGSLPDAISSDAYGRFVFTGNSGESTVSAFTVTATTGALNAVPGSPFSVGRQPTSVAVDSGAHLVYASNNLDSTISGFSVSASGVLTTLAGFPMSVAPLADPIALTIDPRGKLLYVATAASNSVTAYSIDAGTGALTNVGSQPTGNSPNSVAVDPTGRYALVSDSLSSDVYVYAINGPTGVLTQASVSPSSGLGMPYAVAADYSGKRAYVGNGNPSELIGYSLNSTSGALKPLLSSPFSGVSAPFSLSFDPSGSFLYVANNSGNSVSGYTVNRLNGALTPIARPFPAGSAPTAVTVIDSIHP